MSMLHLHKASLSGRAKEFKQKTPLGETRCQCNPYFLLAGCLSIQFFNSPPIPTQSGRPISSLLPI